MKPGSYSSRVRIHLWFEGRRLAVSQVGRDFVVLREPGDIPASTAAQIVIEVDGVPEVLVKDDVRNSRNVEFGPRSPGCS